MRTLPYSFQGPPPTSPTRPFFLNCRVSFLLLSLLKCAMKSLVCGLRASERFSPHSKSTTRASHLFFFNFSLNVKLLSRLCIFGGPPGDSFLCVMSPRQAGSLSILDLPPWEIDNPPFYHGFTVSSPPPCFFFDSEIMPGTLPPLRQRLRIGTHVLVLEMAGLTNNGASPVASFYFALLFCRHWVTPFAHIFSLPPLLFFFSGSSTFVPRKTPLPKFCSSHAVLSVQRSPLFWPREFPLLFHPPPPGNRDVCLAPPLQILTVTRQQAFLTDWTP